MSVFDLSQLIVSYGYLATFGLVALQSVGLPLPGEAAILAASVYAARTHNLSIIGVIAVAAAASFVGSSLGYWLGQSYGRPLLARYGRRFGLGPPRIRLGEYLFASHGGKIVLLGRFLTVLRAYGGVLAGSYRMSASRFHAYNAMGALTWAAVTCFAAYFSGALFPHVHRSVGVAIIVIAGLIILGGALYLRRQEAELQRRADQALIGS